MVSVFLSQYRFKILLLTTVIFFDFLAKYLALQTNPHATLLGFGAILHHNPGITFDIAVPSIILLPISAILLGGILFWMAYTLTRGQFNKTFALLCVFLGAFDNAIDRFITGYTTDYILLWGHSVINLADIAILLGAIFIFRYYKDNPYRRRT